MKNLNTYIIEKLKLSDLKQYNYNLLLKYILEEQESDKEKTTERGKIKFVIWESPDKKVRWLEDNKNYQKIEYKYENKEEGIYIDFLLGFKDDSWRLWIGKIGSVSYDDDPYCNFEVKNFKKAIVMALDKVEEFIEEVKKDSQNYVQYYIN